MSTTAPRDCLTDVEAIYEDARKRAQRAMADAPMTQAEAEYLAPRVAEALARIAADSGEEHEPAA
jgi:hypothetical protein